MKINITETAYEGSDFPEAAYWNQYLADRIKATYPGAEVEISEGRTRIVFVHDDPNHDAIAEAIHAGIEDLWEEFCAHGYKEIFPLRSAYLDACDAARAAEDLWIADESASSDADQSETGRASIAADSARDAARVAWRVSDEVREWEFGSDGYWERGHHHAPSEVESALEAWIVSGDYERSSTLWIEAMADPFDPAIDESDDGDRITVTVTLDPETPKCRKGHEHNWRSPLEVVGGIAENPGVYGHGGGVTIHTVCAHCGTHKHVDTWAQDHRGREGLTSTSYEECDEHSLAWVSSMRKEIAAHRPCCDGTNCDGCSCACTSDGGCER